MVNQLARADLAVGHDFEVLDRRCNDSIRPNIPKKDKKGDEVISF